MFISFLYSYLRAFKALIFVALLAGYIPVIIPTINDKKKITVTNRNGIYDTSMNPRPFAITNDERIIPKTFPETYPKIIPPIPPKNPIIIDSVINKSRISNDFIPIAFIKPTSRVLSRSAELYDICDRNGILTARLSPQVIIGLR